MSDASHRDRPPVDEDPEATVMIPAGRAGPAAPDEDATVMMPAAPFTPAAQEPDPDATVMMSPARPAVPEPDADATVMIPAPAPAPARREAEEDATVAMPAAPAFDPEATIAIPTPGRRRTEATAPVPPPSAAVAAAEEPEGHEGGALNPLVAAAHPIFAVVAQIRHALRHPDPEGLQRALGARLEAFDKAVAGEGLPDEVLAIACAALRHLVDESMASTPWGARRATTFASTLPAAPEPLEALDRLCEHPSENRAILEFLHVCLALGLEGRYRGAPDAREKLQEIRLRLRDLLHTQYPPPDGELSAHWRGRDVPARREPGMLGFWAAGAGAALVLAALYAGFSLSLGGASDPVAKDLATLRLPAPAVPPSAAPAPGLAKLLAAEIEKGEVSVTESAGRATILVRSDRLFASGSARLENAVEPVLLRVAAALDQVPGAIVVAGHTDDVPIRTARFPSNWELSAARAASVVRLMGARLKDATRLSGEGRADAEPVAPNDSEANRARNRRVSIVLRSGA